ncbi:hypothetical protein CAPTEDRAFT_205955 [Capitella teleta]|uniref:Uncharacterized protein n=1 Tax=Capitella teleta TaxID=283909 RepID=R7VFB0_CAPTE|nr:hypothetical protein CAPTEDRAFT_205955 [Capitella teleta]|eukprot:ELU17247.1 hypothetical protein CAPTEDRAFT_205955 [Capitella teleta]
MACGREERSDCCNSKTKSDQYGESIDESFEYTRNEEENDRTRDAGTEYGGASVDNANQWIVHWNPVVSKLNEMRPIPLLIPTLISGIMHTLSIKRSDTLISYITLHALIS